MTTPVHKLQLPLLIVLALLLLALVSSGIFLFKIFQERNTLDSKLTIATQVATEKDVRIASLEKTISEIQQAYSLSEENGSELLKKLSDEQDRNEVMEEQLDDITGTVDKLDKLSRLDPELLQKYSKVFFLNEHYAPGRFKEIDSEFILNPNEPEHIHAEVLPFLEDLLDDAKDDGIELLVLSAFRSYDEQKQLKSTYTVTYGSGANTFSADQGYSEHQLGTTLDFTTKEIGASLIGFQNTSAYAWLQKNAHRYGFVLSYPENNTYYVFEPWHWRFVGEDLADDLHDDGKSFYDLDQRDLDAYLISVFD